MKHLHFDKINVFKMELVEVLNTVYGFISVLLTSKKSVQVHGDLIYRNSRLMICMRMGFSNLPYTVMITSLFFIHSKRIKIKPFISSEILLQIPNVSYLPCQYELSISFK